MAEDGVQLERVRTELAKARQRIAALEAADRERESVARALRERVKELNCLYGISHLLEEPDISLRELLQGTADLLPLAWQYPEITAARIVLDGEQYSTENYREDADCCQVAAVKVHGRQSGIVQVCYLQERPEGDEGPFLQEERSLIDAVAERLGRITERKRMEQALAESEREHRTLFETMAQGVVYQDAEGQIIDANPAAQRILGLTLDQMQGRTSTDPRWRAIHPDGSAFAGDTHPSMVALQTGRQVRNVVMGVYSPRNEAYTWININAVPQLRPGDSRPYQVYATFEDITAQVRALQDLQQEKDRAQKYLDIAGVILVIIAPDQTVALINQKGCEILGYREQEIVGQNWFELFVPKLDRAWVVAAFEQLMAGELALTEYLENAIVTRDGEKRVIAWHNTILRDEAGNINGTLSSGEDITERVRTEQALRESEERFRIVSELTSDGAYALRIEPGGAIEVEWMTDAFTRVTGLPQTEFDNIERWLDLIHPQDLSVFEQRMQTIQAGREDVSEYRIRAGNGGWRWVRDYGRPLWDEEQGRVVRVYGAIQDVTERARAEEALRVARDELERRVQERTAELAQGRQRETVINALLRLSMQEASLDEQLGRALDEILAIPWLPVLRQGAIFVADAPGNLHLHAHRGLGPAFEVACARVALGHCLCGQAAASGAIEFADRIDERHEVHYEGMSPHGHYCVPILSAAPLAVSDSRSDRSAGASTQTGRTVIGMLVLYLAQGHRRDPQEAAFLQAVAHTLAGIIERAHAEEALRQNEQRLRRLNVQLQVYSRSLERRVSERTQEIERRRQVAESLGDILTVLNSDRPLDEALEYIVSEARRLLGSNASAIYRHQDPSEGFRVQTAVGRVAQWTGHAVLPLQLAQALRQGQPVAFSERPDGTLVREHAGLSQLFPPNCLDPECQALLAVPLIVAGEIYGALVLYYAQPRAFHEEEVNLAVAFADQATLSIENAHLHRRAAEAAVVQERARLARELHDSVTQSLYSLTLLAEGWRRLEAAGRLEDADDPLTELGEIAQQALKEMRLMVYELRPPALEQEGLLGALHQRLGAVEQRAGVEARLLAQEIVELPARTEEGLYRIAIEALNNALKHASATTVTVHIRVDAGNVRADVEQAILEVVDDGVGFDVELNAHSPGMGLRTMRERAEELGGTLAIRSAPGEGARIVARVPL